MTEENRKDVGDKMGNRQSVSEDHVNSSGSENEFHDDDVVGDSSDDSLDGTLDKCPICLRILRQQEIGMPDTCEHCFCLKCIMEWAENVTTCPIDRKVFHSVLALDKVDGQVVRVEELAPNANQQQDYDDFADPTFCEICGCCDREDRLLLCDDCDDGYHLECLDPPLDAVPDSDWWCTTCAAARHRELNEIDNSGRNFVRRSRSRMPRTGLSRRIMQRRRRDTTSINHLSSSTFGVCPPRMRRNQSVYDSIDGSSRSLSRHSFTRGSKSGRGTRRGKKRRTQKRRVAKERKPATPRGRLIQQLGILPLRPGQVYVGLPSCRPTHPPTVEPSTSAAAIRTQRHQAGIAPLRIYSTVNDLADYFEMSSEDESGVAVMRPQPIRITDNRKRLLAAATAHEASSINVLGSILSRQHILLQDKNMQISSADGRLVPSISVDVDKLLLSPFNENDSSGYDSFGHKGSPPRRKTSPAIFTTAITTSSGQNSPNQKGTSRSDNSSNASAQSSSSSSNTRVLSSERTVTMHGSSNSWSNPSGSSGNYGNPFDDLGSLEDPTERCAQNKKTSTESEKEEDEFNIYSDIEDDPRPITRRSLDAISVPETIDPSMLECIGGGDPESDNESDMIIDEAGESGPIEGERQNTNDTVVSGSEARQGANNERSESGSESLPGDVEPDLPDSPLSIPLPDTTPPPSVHGGPNADDDNSSEVASSDEVEKEEIKIKPKDEYDPCHPLTSSDEEEEVPLPESEEPVRIDIAKVSALKASSSSQLPTSFIPLPTSEDSRRPTIQFSIPSRHRIFSMGSLIRRNKGVMKKETKPGDSISFQSEMSKAFVSRRADEEPDGTVESEKISLVAEIFGSDDDEREESPNPPTIEQSSILVPHSSISMPTVVELLPESTPVVESTTERPPAEVGSKWKKIVENEQLPVPVEPHPPPSLTNIESDDDEVVVIGETPSEVQIIETPPPEPEDQIQEVHDEKGSTVEESRRDGDELKENSYVDSSSESEDEFERQKLRERRINAKKRGEERRLSKSSRKDHKKETSSRRARRHSTSISPGSNREEGEILDVPEKKKKRPKKSKKSKKRRRSTSSSSEVVSFTEKKIPEDVHVPVREQEEARVDVHWKKPSKSSKQRNYRDGKPKTEEGYFRGEKKTENNTFRNRDTDKSPFLRHTGSPQEEVRREQQRPGRRRSSTRDGRTHSKYSNRTSSCIRNYKSRSRSRSPKPRTARNRRDLSVSPRQWRSSPPLPDSHRSDQRSISPTKRQGSKRARSDKRTKQRSQSSSPSPAASPHRKKSASIENVLRKPKHDVVERKVKEKEVEVETPPVTEPATEKKSSNVEKDKKKKKKRREKSISPAKAIFADGDSIVVSLNFQKGKGDTSDKEVPCGAEPSKSLKIDSRDKKGYRVRSSSKDKTSKEKSKAVKKTVLIDLESSPIQEQNIGISPTLIVLSDDDEHHERNLKGDESDPERLAVSTTSTAETSKSPAYRDRDCHGAPADSTQIQLYPIDEQVTSQRHGRHGTTESDTVATLARGDALVTSTRDSVDRSGTAQDDYAGSPCTPPKEPSPNYNQTPPLPTASPALSAPASMSPERQKRNTAITHGLGPNPPASHQQLVTNLGVRPVAPTVCVGGLPGLFPTNGMPTFGAGTVPQQLSALAQPLPQLRLSTPLFNQSALATMANMLYRPLLGSQSLFGTLTQPAASVPSRMPGNVITPKKPMTGTVLPLKDQNSSQKPPRPEGSGDSPFSPNSSDGDDLFEPPKDSSHHASVKSGGSGGHRGDKGPVSDIHHLDGGTCGVKGKGRPAARIFDTLFGGPVGKPESRRKHGKPEGKSSKLGPQKSRSKKGNDRKPPVSEGELRLTEEVPTSAVELRVKEKFLKKLNRQERVVEEVKVSLKPHYSKKHITKEEYKDILRRAVPKICHNKTGEINPIKIKELVEAYVKKIRKVKKK